MYSQDPASPRRVQAVAHYLCRVLEAARPPGIPEDFVTIDINNRELKVAVNLWSEDHRDIVADVADIFDNPIASRESFEQRDQLKRWINIARAVCRFNTKLFIDPLQVTQTDRERRIIDTRFIDHVDSLAKDARKSPRVSEQPASIVRGTTSVYTPVLKIGRDQDTDDAQLKATIIISDKPVEIGLHEKLGKEQEDRFFDLAKKRCVARVKLETTWKVQDGQHVLAVSGSVAIAIDEVSPASGNEVIEAFYAAAPSLAMPGTLHEILEEKDRVEDGAG